MFCSVSCPSTQLLDIQFVSFTQFSLGFRTRVPKFDRFNDVHLTCVAMVCDPASTSRKLSFCDRSCAIVMTPSTQSTTSTQKYVLQPVKKRQLDMASLGGAVNELVQQGPFIVEDTGLGPLVRNDGSLWINSAQFIGTERFSLLYIQIDVTIVCGFHFNTNLADGTSVVHTGNMYGLKMFS